MTMTHSGQSDLWLASPRVQVCRVLGFAFALLAVTALVFHLLGVRINVTPSIPLGLYIRTAPSPAVGLIAEFCPSGMSLVESERYRGFGTGCPDRAIPLLKPVVAVVGDRVTFSAAGLSVNGEPLPNTAPRLLDGKGRAMRLWPAGTITVPAGMVVVASTHHPGSYDSRYLGPIRVADIRSNLRPLWIASNSIESSFQTTSKKLATH